MSSIIIFLYSKYIPQARLILETVKKLDYVHTLCVDNELVREIIKRSSIIKHKKVPCFIVIYPNKSVFQYLDNEAILFLNKLIEMENQKLEAAASSKSSVSDILPEVSLENPNNYQQQPVPQPTPPQVTSIKEDVVSAGRYSSKSVQYKKENRGDTQTHSQNDLVNYGSLSSKNNNIAQGSGHEKMAKSSLSNNQSDNLSVIEDLFEEENNDGLLIKETKNTENPTISKKSSMKDIMNDMIAERENFDTTNKKQTPY